MQRDAQTAQVTPRIYAQSVETPAIWHLLIADGADPARGISQGADGYIELAANVAMGPGPVPPGRDDLLCFATGTPDVPPWLRSRLCPPDLNAACAELHRTLVAVEHSLGRETVLSTLQTAVLRVLIVHSWRRVVLRHPDLPGGFFPPGWQGPACRALVWQLLSRLPRPALAELERARP